MFMVHSSSNDLQSLSKYMTVASNSGALPGFKEALFPGSRSRTGEENLVTLGQLNRGLPPPGSWRNQSDCRRKTCDYFVGVFTFTAVLTQEL